MELGFLWGWENTERCAWAPGEPLLSSNSSAIPTSHPVLPPPSWQLNPKSSTDAEPQRYEPAACPGRAEMERNPVPKWLPGEARETSPVMPAGSSLCQLLAPRSCSQ